MAKKYGGYTGSPGEINPTKASAPGAWQAPIEVSRQRGLDLWPLFIEGATTEPGMYVYAASTAVATGLLDAGFDYLIPSGQDVSRTDYENLFNVFGTFYGVGDGFTTFGLPDLVPNQGERTFKFTTTSGLSNASAIAKGKLPNHTHSVQANPSNSPYPSGNGSPPGTPGGGYTLTTSYDGTAAGNVPKRLYMAPLLACSTVPVPVGCLFPVLAPNQLFAYPLIPANAINASGQELDRTTYASLFASIGTLYGSGDGSTTFNLPDTRGVFISHPYPDLLAASGTAGTSGSGFYYDDFASHAHTWNTNITQGQGQGFTPGSQPPVTTPATGSSSIGGTENRPNNFTAVICLVTN
jgi:microcystin-dependent protein